MPAGQQQNLTEFGPPPDLPQSIALHNPLVYIIMRKHTNEQESDLFTDGTKLTDSGVSSQDGWRQPRFRIKSSASGNGA